MKVKYEQLFPTASFLNCRIGFETDIPDDGNVDMELTHLKEMAIAFHMKEFPHLYNQNKPIYQGEENIKEIPLDKPLSTEQSVINAINQCTTVSVLESFKLLVKNNPQLQQAYDNRLKELKND